MIARAITPRRLPFFFALILALAVSPACTCADAPSLDASVDGSGDVQNDLSEASYDVFATDSAPLSECEQAAQDRSVVGCEYWAFSPNHFDEAGCGVVFLSNISSVDAQVNVNFKTNSLDPTLFMRLVQGAGKSLTYVTPTASLIPAGQTAVVSLFQGNPFNQHDCDCPSPAAMSNVMVPVGAAGNAFHISTSVPVAAVFDHPYACPDDHVEGSTALRSVGNWDTRYRDTGSYLPGRAEWQRDFGGLLVTTDPTATAVIASTTLNAMFTTDSGPQQFKLIRGNVLTLNQDDYHIGSLVTGSSPIALWTIANTEMPFDYPSSDFNYLQIAPLADWASEYAAVPFPSRYLPADKGSIWRLVGDSDGTQLSYEPAAPPGAPTLLNAGELALFRSTSPFVIRSQDSAHVFSVTQTMTSCTDTTGDTDAGALYGPDGGQIVGCPGDPQLQNTQAAWEYANHYVFLTNPAYPTTKLVFIRKKDASGFHDVTLECAGIVSGWSPIGSSDYQFSYLTVSDDNFAAQVFDGGTCENGSHTADSTGNFSVAVWQWGTYLANDLPIIGYDNVSVGYAVPGRSVSPRALADGGVH